MDISHLAPGTQAKLVFRLVNNDTDEETNVRIESVVVIPDPDVPPTVTIGLVNDTAPEGPGHDVYLTDLLTNDPRVAGTAQDDQGVEQLEIQMDNGSFVDITASLLDDHYSFDPGVLEPGPHQVVVRATDELNQSSQSLLPFVMNAPPTPDAGGDRQIDEGVSLSFDASGSTDSVGDIFSYHWAFHDGSSLANVTATKWYAQDNRARVQMLGEGTGQANEMFHLPAPLAVDEVLVIDGETVAGWQLWLERASLLGSGPDDPHYVLDRDNGTIRFGDGIRGRRPEAGQRFRATYPDVLDAVFPVTLTVTDTAGSVVADTVEVVVGNLPADIAPSDDIRGVEGDLVSLQVSFLDPGVLDTHTAEIQWGDGSTSVGQVHSVNGQGTVEDEHAYTDNGDYAIVVQIMDDGNALASAEVGARINNVAPLAYISGPAAESVDIPVTFALSAEDPSPIDMQSAFTYEIDWDGDAVVDQTIVGPATGLQIEHSYETTGDYTITVAATDKDGDTGPTAAHTLTIVAGGVCFIGGTVYLDVDNDGVKDAVEIVLPNVPITLVGDVNKTVLTDSNGWYEFANLPPGNYDVLEMQPAAFQDGKDTQGEPLFGHRANDMFYEMQLPSQAVARHYNFGEMGLIAELVSKSLLLASTTKGSHYPCLWVAYGTIRRSCESMGLLVPWRSMRTMMCGLDSTRTEQYEVYDGQTGEFKALVATPGNPYGAVIDGEGQLWGSAISTGSSTILTRQPTPMWKGSRASQVARTGSR